MQYLVNIWCKNCFGGGWSDDTHRENIDGIGGNIYSDSALSTIYFGIGGRGGYGLR